MVVTEMETGLRELGKATQDFVLAYYCENMPSAHEHMHEIMAIMEQFADADYHIEVFLRMEYPSPAEGQKGDVIERALFVVHTVDKDFPEMHNAEIAITIFVNEANEIIGKGNIEVINAPLLASDPHAPSFMATDFFGGMLNMVTLRKDERSH